MFFPPTHPLLPLPDNGLSTPCITIHYKNMSACSSSIHPATACSPPEKNLRSIPYSWQAPPPGDIKNELQARGIALPGVSLPWLPFFLNALWAQSKLSASMKALRLSTQKVHLTLLRSTIFTTHAQNKYVKQPAPMLQRMCRVHERTTYSLCTESRNDLLHP